jgi:hypothetical protein
MEITRESHKVPTRPRRIQSEESDWRTFHQDLSFIGGPRKRQGRKLISFQVLSAIVDGLLILGFSLLLSAAYLWILNTHTGHLLLHRWEFSQFFMMIFCWVQFCYLVVLRTFVGCTVGEKAFDIRLGLYQERFLLSYPFKVLLRSMLIIASGIIILPVLSWLFKRDLAGDLTGIKIQSLV